LKFPTNKRQRSKQERRPGAGHNIMLSPISSAEIVYLVETNRLLMSAYDDLRNALADPEYVIEEAPFTEGVVEAHAAGATSGLLFDQR
jgi:hypothetical protein